MLRALRIKIFRHGPGPDELERVAAEDRENYRARVPERDEKTENQRVGLLLLFDAIVLQQEPRQFAI